MSPKIIVFRGFAVNAWDWYRIAFAEFVHGWVLGGLRNLLPIGQPHVILRP